MPDLLRGINATFDHVAHGTRSIKSLIPIYRDLLGGEFIGGGEVARVGFRSVQFRFEGGGKVELLEATEGSTFLDSFFRRTGDGGLHHVTFKVPDINEALDAAKAAGLEPFGVHLEDEFWQEFFLHPRTTGGALLQLAHASFDLSGREGADADTGADLGPRMSIEEFLENPVGYWRE